MYAMTRRFFVVGLAMGASIGMALHQTASAQEQKKPTISERKLNEAKEKLIKEVLELRLEGATTYSPKEMLDIKRELSEEITNIVRAKYNIKC